VVLQLEFPQKPKRARISAILLVEKQVKFKNLIVLCIIEFPWNNVSMKYREKEAFHRIKEG